MEYAEAETEEFLAPKEMKEIAFATVSGNHDNALVFNKENFGYGGITGHHYDFPNDDGYSGHYLDNSSGNFYFSSGELLVVGITAPCDIAPNNENSCSFAVNRTFIEKAVAAHPEDSHQSRSRIFVYFLLRARERKIQRKFWWLG